jgi:hypothetical protein
LHASFSVGAGAGVGFTSSFLHDNTVDVNNASNINLFILLFLAFVL